MLLFSSFFCRARGCLAAICSTALLAAADLPRIAIFSGPRATIQNNKPLITSNKAREEYGLPLLEGEDGKPLMDVPRYQRLAAPVTVYIEMFTAHPLEADATQLYAPPDGFVNAQGQFSKERTSAADKPVYAVTLKPEDGLYALPYMGRQANGQAWEATGTRPGASIAESRQTFVPDASRIFEEMERNGSGIRELANYDFYRGVPAGGYIHGLAADKRNDVGTGDIPPEKLGKDFFAYGPYEAGAQTRGLLAQSANRVQQVMNTGKYAGALWLEGSPSVEDTSYWLSLMIDSKAPILVNSAHRNRGEISPDGDANILNSVEFILSKVWADEQGRNQLGAVMVQDEVIYSAREIVKGDAHPGGYVATGGYGGILGSMTAGPYVTFIPTRKHTWKSEVRIDQLPAAVEGLIKQNGVMTPVRVAVKNAAGELLPSAIPKVIMVKGDLWYDDSFPADPKAEKGLIAGVNQLLEQYPLSGIIAEGLAPYAVLSAAQEAVLERAALCGIPVVKTARGDVHGFVRTNPNNLVIEGSNSISTKARLLLTAALMKYGSLPPAADPDHPAPAEIAAIKAKVALYQHIFDTH